MCMSALVFENICIARLDAHEANDSRLLLSYRQEILPSLLLDSHSQDGTGLAEGCGCDYDSHSGSPHGHGLCMIVFPGEVVSVNPGDDIHPDHCLETLRHNLGLGNSPVCDLLLVAEVNEDGPDFLSED